MRGSPSLIFPMPFSSDQGEKRKKRSTSRLSRKKERKRGFFFIHIYCHIDTYAVKKKKKKKTKLKKGGKVLSYSFLLGQFFDSEKRRRCTSHKLRKKKKKEGGRGGEKSAGAPALVCYVRIGRPRWPLSAGKKEGGSGDTLFTAKLERKRGGEEKKNG